MHLSYRGPVARVKECSVERDKVCKTVLEQVGNGAMEAEKDKHEKEDETASRRRNHTKFSTCAEMLAGLLDA